MKFLMGGAFLLGVCVCVVIFGVYGVTPVSCAAALGLNVLVGATWARLLS